MSFSFPQFNLAPDIEGEKKQKSPKQQDSPKPKKALKHKSQKIKHISNKNGVKKNDKLYKANPTYHKPQAERVLDIVKRAIQDGLFYLDTRATRENLIYDHSNNSKTSRFYKYSNNAILGLKNHILIFDKSKVDNNSKPQIVKINTQPKQRYLDIDWKYIKKNTISAIPKSEIKKTTAYMDHSFIALDQDLEFENIETLNLNNNKIMQLQQRLSIMDNDLRSNSKNINLWLQYLEMQADLVEMTFKDSSSIKQESTLAEIQISICERALQFNPDSIMLQEKYMTLCLKLLGHDEILSRWDLLLEKQWHPMLELGKLNYIQGHFSTFVATEMTEIFTQTFIKLENYKKVYKNLLKISTRIQINVVLRYISFLLESGYTEKSLALLQAFIEWNFCNPLQYTNTDMTSLRKSFEEYWEFSEFKIGDELGNCWMNYSNLDNIDTVRISNNKKDIENNINIDDLYFENEQKDDNKNYTWLNKESYATKTFFKPLYTIEDSDSIFTEDSKPPNYSADPFRFIVFDDISSICADPLFLTPFEKIQMLGSLFKIFGVYLPSITTTTKISDSTGDLYDNTTDTEQIYTFDFASDPYLDSPGEVWASSAQQNFNDDEFSSIDGLYFLDNLLKSQFSDVKIKKKSKNFVNLTISNYPTFKNLIGSMVGFCDFCSEYDSKIDNHVQVVPLATKYVYNPIQSIRKNNIFSKFIGKIIFELLNLTTIEADVKEWLSLCYILLESSESHKSGKKASKKILKQHPNAWILWDLYANIEVGYGNYDEAKKIWYGALSRLAKDSVENQSFSIIMWLNLITLYIHLGDIDSTRKSLVVMYFPQLWDVAASGVYVDLNPYLIQVKQMMEKKYLKWTEDINPAEWYAGLIVASIYCYYYPNNVVGDNEIYIVDLEAAEKKLTDCKMDLEADNILSKNTNSNLVSQKASQSLNLVKTTLHELIISQIASLNYFHNNSSKLGYQPKHLREILINGIYTYPSNSCLWELLVRTESKSWTINNIENISQRLLNV
ncbi:hypothetical protein BB561_005303 [Smittium simulii]|uniref:DUF1740-domain-containing protein n=1 Tax=Smittium simulii TaxID=133385 RepID=A0A2T9YAZ6_9FUNG|nr:hypothetical protein BB561_005303 [Smittium simulii]